MKHEMRWIEWSGEPAVQAKVKSYVAVTTAALTLIILLIAGTYLIGIGLVSFLRSL